MVTIMIMIMVMMIIIIRQIIIIVVVVVVVVYDQNDSCKNSEDVPDGPKNISVKRLKSPRNCCS